MFNSFFAGVKAFKQNSIDHLAVSAVEVLRITVREPLCRHRPLPFQLPFSSLLIFDNLIRAMLAKFYSAAVYGVDAYRVGIEVTAPSGNPKIATVDQKKLLTCSAPLRHNEASMKKFIALTVVLTAVIGLAISFAGSEPYQSKEVMPAPPPCDWSGFYLGLNVGVAGLNTTITDIDDWWDYGAWTPEDTNFAGGGQVGYNWQHGAFVFGVEGDADYLGTDHTITYQSTPLDSRWRGMVDFQGSFRARGGVTVDKALIYATGGVALSHGRSAYLSEEPGFNAYQDEWQAGFVGGAGIEYMMNCHWSARLEALYSHYPRTSTTISGDDFYHFDIQNNVYSVRVGINYLFGGPR